MTAVRAPIHAFGLHTTRRGPRLAGATVGLLAVMCAAGCRGPVRSGERQATAQTAKAGAAAAAPTASSPTLRYRATVRVAGASGATWRVALAETEAARTRGLMFVRDLPEGHGMLFDMGVDDVHTFWMRNTYIPLDMVFLDRNLRVVGVVEAASPLSDDLRHVDAPSRYVLEVNAHEAGQRGLRPGVAVSVERDAPVAGEVGAGRAR
jgi:uncharacterized membrane protein (UPF0127 family)